MSLDLKLTEDFHKSFQRVVWMCLAERARWYDSTPMFSLFGKGNNGVSGFTSTCFRILEYPNFVPTETHWTCGQTPREIVLSGASAWRKFSSWLTTNTAPS